MTFRTTVAIAAVAVASSLSGCAGTQPVAISETARTSLQGAPVTIVTHSEPSFVAMTVGKGAFAMLGALAAIADGEQLVKDHHIPDPALAVAARMTPVLQQRFKSAGAKSISDPEDKLTTDGALASAAGNQGVVLDIVTTGWGFFYTTKSLGHYAINMNLKARLIDAGSGKVIALSTCVPPDGKQWGEDLPKPTYDEMMADDTALIKSRMLDAANACSILIEKNMFGG
jgi:hypothetical protein